MSQKGSPAIIGLFAIGAAVVLAAVVIILGNISFGDEKCNCVLYFQGSLHGLNEGASVTYRGVKIGQVSDIAITFDPQARDYRTPVYVEIDKEYLGRSPGDRDAEKPTEKQFLQDMIANGLRAKLEMQSLVTGQLYIDFDFYPETKPRYSGVKKEGYLEIPTLPSKMEQLTSALSNLELDSLINRAVDALDNLNSFLTAESTREIARDFSKTFEHLDSLIVNTDKSLPGFVDDFRSLANDFNSISRELSLTLEGGRKELGPVSTDLRKTLSEIDKVAASITSVSENVRQMTDRNSRLYYELHNSFHEVAQAAESVKALADLLQRNPDVLLYGPREEEKK